MREKRIHLRVDRYWLMANIPRGFMDWSFVGDTKNAQLMELQSWLGFFIDAFTFDQISDEFIFIGINFKIPSLKKLRAEHCNLTFLDLYNE